jgi:hypothetical protein
MAVYKEGYSAINRIKRESVQIYDDACDFGAPVKKGDSLWNELKQLVDWYSVEGTKSQSDLGCSAEIYLMDEWAVSDERKTIHEAEEFYLVTYNKCVSGACKGYDGYINVDKINK